MTSSLFKTFQVFALILFFLFITGKIYAIQGQLNYGFGQPQETVVIKDVKEINDCNKKKRWAQHHCSKLSKDEYTSEQYAKRRGQKVRKAGADISAIIGGCGSRNVPFFYLNRDSICKISERDGLPIYFNGSTPPADHGWQRTTRLNPVNTPFTAPYFSTAS